MADKKISAFKGFDKNLQCRGFQFEVGKTYTATGTVKACSNGFHACENPWDVLGYYDFGEGNRFAKVTLSGRMDVSGEDKIAAETITVENELTFGEMVGALVAYQVAETKGKGDKSSGDYARIGSSGDYARIGSSGYGARIGSSGDYARIGSSGDGARIGSSGYYARIGSSGDYARIGSSGDGARIGSSGDGARITIEGSDAVTAVAGRHTWVRASKPAWVSLASYDCNGKCEGFATGQMGADGLKLDTWYRAEGCKLVECEA